uniref:Uncharacterized protein n=1 Tax=Arundo donax TaxID=35708 RepID=A0A0A9CCH5_ARUDO
MSTSCTELEEGASLSTSCLEL